MSPLVSLRGQPALAGFVKDARTGKGLGGVCVAISAGPTAFAQQMKILRRSMRRSPELRKGRPDRTESRADGLFVFRDLPEGDYQIRAMARAFGGRYGSAKQSVTAVRDKERRYELHWAQLVLPPTLVTGVIRSRKSAIALARIWVQGSGESAFSDGAGRYSIACIEPGGARTLRVSAQGFQAAKKPLVIAAPGLAVTVDFDLTAAPS